MPVTSEEHASSFGVDLAKRVTPRTASHRRLAPYRLVGVVGQSALGFGRAIGRSTAVRPVVTLDSLDSLALRPPTGWWHDEAVQPAIHVTASTAETELLRPQPRQTWTGRLLPGARTATARGRDEPEAGNVIRATAGFVPSGDNKVDALRRLLMGAPSPKLASNGATGSADPGFPPRATGVAPDQGSAAEARSAAGADAAHPRSVDAARGDTTAGPSTGPGGLGRRVRPESIDPDQPARSASLESSERTRQDRRSAPPGAPGPRSSTDTRPAAGRGNRSKAPLPDGRVEQLRRMYRTESDIVPPAARADDGPAAFAPATRHAPLGSDRAPAAEPPDVGGTSIPDHGVLTDRTRNEAAPDVRDTVDPATGFPAELHADTAQPRITDEITVSDRPAQGGIEGRRSPATNGRQPVAVEPSTLGAAERLVTTDTATIPRQPLVAEPAAPDNMVGSESNYDTRPVRPAVRPAAPLDPLDRDSPDRVSTNPAAAASVTATDVGDRAAPPHADEPRSRTQPAAPPPVYPTPPDSGHGPERAGAALTSDALRSHTAEVSTTPSMRTEGPSAADSATVITNGAEQAPATIERRHDLRVQRMLTAAHHPALQERGDLPVAPVSSLSIAALGDRAATSLADSNGVDDFSQAPADSRVADDGQFVAPRSTAPSPSSPRPRPTLPVVRRSADSVVRRVTLPRALSYEHRPDTSAAVRRLAGDAVRPVSIGLPAVLPVHETAEEPRQPAAGDIAFDASAMRAAFLRGSWSLVRGSVGLLDDVVRRRRTGAERIARAAPTQPTEGTEPGIDLVSRFATSDTPRSGRSRRDSRATDGTLAGLVDPSPPARSTPAPVVPEATDGSDLAEQFMTELSRTVRRSPRPLPSPYRPIADTIVGNRRVMLSTDTASRQALRSVGKVAATTGDTIHLDSAAIAARRTGEVLAHELTHVAHPSPAVRFFDDVVDSPEERRAEAVARVMARGPLSPSSSTLVRPGAKPRGDAATIRRSPAASSPGAIKADTLAASIIGGARGGDTAEVIRREMTSTPSVADSEPATSSSRAPSVPPAPERAASGDRSGAFDLDSDEARRWLERHIDMIMRRIEDRIIVDLERRGGRRWGGI
ncbi:MAG TPA: DUF4157 domain-containing protein [Ilumatobacter sp.]|nr:DUF4157 domain-containing protein [Ilumatobacter sp.]